MKKFCTIFVFGFLMTSNLINTMYKPKQLRQLEQKKAEERNERNKAVHQNKSSLIKLFEKRNGIEFYVLLRDLVALGIDYWDAKILENDGSLPPHFFDIWNGCVNGIGTVNAFGQVFCKSLNIMAYFKFNKYDLYSHKSLSKGWPENAQNWENFKNEAGNVFVIKTTTVREWPRRENLI